jgi:tetratricopeptide (TPR) repeat protein
MRFRKKKADHTKAQRSSVPQVAQARRLSIVWISAWWTSTLLAVAACGGAIETKPRAGSQKETVEMEELHITAQRQQDGGYNFQVYDASELFSRATALARQGQCDDAVMLYDKIEGEFSSSAYLSASLYNAGLCLQNSGKLTEAVERYNRLRERVPDGPDAKDAAFQLLALSLGLKRWQEALESAETILARTDISPTDRLEALSQRVSALVELERLDEAAVEARGAVAYYRTRPPDQVISDPFYAAQANYLLAETFRRRAGAMQFTSTDLESQRAVLTRRAELLLEAQREYFNAIQFQNARWAAAAGYQIGHMYDDLWQAIIGAPAPEDLSVEAREVYRVELAKLIEPLIRHAIRYWELTLMMIERTGAGQEWMERTKQELEKARERLLAQQPSGRPETPSGSAAAPPAVDTSEPARPRDIPKTEQTPPTAR